MGVTHSLPSVPLEEEGIWYLRAERLYASPIPSGNRKSFIPDATDTIRARVSGWGEPLFSTVVPTPAASSRCNRPQSSPWLNSVSLHRLRHRGIAALVYSRFGYIAKSRNAPAIPMPMHGRSGPDFGCDGGIRSLGYTAKLSQWYLSIGAIFFHFTSWEHSH